MFALKPSVVIKKTKIYYKKCHIILKNDGIIRLIMRIFAFVTSTTLQPLDPDHRYRFKIHTSKNKLKNRTNYTASPNPYHVIYVDPSRISHRLTPNNRGTVGLLGVRYCGLGLIKSGDWDNLQYYESVKDVPQISYFTERYSENKSPTDTDLYNFLINHTQRTNNRMSIDFDSVKSYANQYCNNYDKLFEQISERGYIQGHKSVKAAPEAQHADISDRLEVLVLIDRSGKIRLYDGQHRFGIARALGIEIPVQVLCRHEQWQKYRDYIYRNRHCMFDQSSLTHPDLADI
jgi:hypothetical protein